jgi:small subunit ribosomal protein S16
MALTIRLARFGQKKRPFYRVVVTEKQSRRDGNFVDLVGTYNPMTEPSSVVLKEDRIKNWVSKGALPSPLVRKLIQDNFPGLLEEREKNQRSRIQAARKKRKERAASRSKAA